jgi:hypothetical protein
LSACGGAAADDLWALLAGNRFPWLAHWDGTNWSWDAWVPGVKDALFYYGASIYAAAANDVWAVGTTFHGGNKLVPYVRHWDGARLADGRPLWDVALCPDYGEWGVLNAVHGRPGVAPWAVGRWSLRGEGYLVRWNGYAWEPQRAPALNELSAWLAVHVVADDDAWAGGCGFNYGGPSWPLIAHWDGRTWERVDIPVETGSHINLVSGISAVTANDVWAVGALGGCALHWDGTSWSAVDFPIRDSWNASAVSAIAADDVWISGIGHPNSYPLLAHWDGTTWSEVATPALIGPNGLPMPGILTDLVAVDGRLIAVGGSLQDDPMSVNGPSGV